VLVSVNDKFKNKVIEQQNVLLALTAATQTVYASYTAQTSSLYQATYAIPAKDDENSMCGVYSLSNFLLK